VSPGGISAKAPSVEHSGVSIPLEEHIRIAGERRLQGGVHVAVIRLHVQTWNVSHKIF